MAWNPGQQLFGGRYIIERKLGEGGIGITYLAKNRRSELRVIKTLREQIFNDPAWIPHQDKLRHDFRDEALRLVLCRHPHIVQVENVFDEDNLPCMAMEYIAGEDLGKRITEKGALPEGEALQYIRQIGDALTLLHEKGLLHRDLKPGNIMMRAGKPEAVLIDFGLVRQFISGAVQQHTESVTHGFAPPEQYLPDAERGEYIDVYALAATLYSLLTGQLPMSAPARLQNFTMRSPKELNGNVSDRVNEAIMKGMALNYKFRPQSVQEWLDLLGYASHNWECVHTIPGTSPNLAFRMKSIAISPDGKTIASGSKIWDLQTGELLRSYNGYGFVAFSPDAQTLATNCDCWDNRIGIWECSTGKLLHSLNWSGYLDYPIAISPNGKFLATSRTWTLVYFVGEDVDEYIKSEPVFPYIGIWDLKTKKLIHEIAGHHFEVADVAFSPDSQILASGSIDGGIKLWNVNTGKLILSINENAEEIYLRCFWAYMKNPELSLKIYSDEAVNSITFNPQGSILASSAVNTINFWNPITGQLIRTLSGHSCLINWINFSPDGKILASGSRDNTIKLWEVNTGNEICTFSEHYDCVNCVTFSPNGQILASCDASGNIKIWRSQLVVQ